MDRLSTRSADATLAITPQEAVETVSEIMQTLGLLLPLNETLNRIARKLSTLIGFSFCAIMLPDERDQGMRVEGSYGLDSGYIVALNDSRHMLIHAGLTAGSPTTRAYREGVPVVISDVLSEPSFAPLRSIALKQGYRSLVSMPMFLQERTIGVLNGYAPAPRDYSPGELRLLAAASSQAAVAIELARRLAEQERTIKAFQAANEELQRQRQILERLGALHQNLTDQVLFNSGPRNISSALAHALGRRIYVWDQFCRLLWSSAPASDPQETGAEGFDLPDSWAQKLVRASHRDLVRFHLPKKGSLALSPVIIGHERLGYVGLIESSPLADPEVRMLEQGAAVLALELMKQKVAADTEARLRADMVTDLLRIEHEDVEALIQRGRLYGWDLTKPRQVLVAAVDNGTAGSSIDEGPANEDRDRLLTAVGSFVEERWPGALLTRIGNHLAAACAVPPGGDGGLWGPELDGQFRRRLPHMSGQLTIAIGVGSICESPLAYRHSYQQALACLELLHRLGNKGRYLCVAQLGLFETLLFNIKDPKPLIESAGAILRPLLQYDEEKRGELLRTLEAFLDHAGDIRTTADALYIHPNTLKYRVQKVESMCGRDMKNGHDLLQFALSVTIRRIAGDDPHQFPPSPH